MTVCSSSRAANRLRVGVGSADLRTHHGHSRQSRWLANHSAASVTIALTFVALLLALVFPLFAAVGARQATFEVVSIKPCSGMRRELRRRLGVSSRRPRTPQVSPGRCMGTARRRCN